MADTWMNSNNTDTEGRFVTTNGLESQICEKLDFKMSITRPQRHPLILGNRMATICGCVAVYTKGF